MKSAGAEVHHYDVTNDDKLFAEFLKAQMSMGSLNTAAQVSGGQLKKLFFYLKEIAALEVLRIYLIALQVIDGELSRS